MSGVPKDRHLEAAEGYLALGMPDHAIAELDARNRRLPDDARAHALRAEALRGRGEHAAAVAEFEQSLLLGEPTLPVLLGFAWCLKRTDSLDRAIAVMERAYERHSDEPIVMYNLACYHALQGDKDTALSWLGRAIRREQSLRDLVADERDFDPIRGDPDFQFVTGGLESLDD